MIIISGVSLGSVGPLSPSLSDSFDGALVPGSIRVTLAPDNWSAFSRNRFPSDISSTWGAPPLSRKAKASLSAA
ncbi:hypothetical protein D3C77_682460 [compost metagenome]